MKKPTDLRAHLANWVPELAAHPDKLHLFVDKGRIVAKLGASLSFEYRYQLQIVVTDFSSASDTLIVPLLIWINDHQPNLLLDEKLQQSVVAFEAEVLDHERSDIGLTLELSERVLVQPAPAGGYSCTHVGEPALPDLGGPTGWQIYLNGELLAES